MLFFTILFIIRSDFPICDTIQHQTSPDLLCVNDTFFIFWNDMRYYSDSNQVYAVFGARVLPDGTILDPDSKEIYCDTAYGKPDAAYDGNNLLVVLREGKGG